MKSLVYGYQTIEKLEDINENLERLKEVKNNYAKTRVKSIKS